MGFGGGDVQREKCSDILTQLQRQRPCLLVDKFQDSNKPQCGSVCLCVCWGGGHM
jgi:hypothetical protein